MYLFCGSPAKRYLLPARRTPPTTASLRALRLSLTRTGGVSRPARWRWRDGEGEGEGEGEGGRGKYSFSSALPTYVGTGHDVHKLHSSCTSAEVQRRCCCCYCCTRKTEIPSRALAQFFFGLTIPPDEDRPLRSLSLRRPSYCESTTLFFSITILRVFFLLVLSLDRFPFPIYLIRLSLARSVPNPIPTYYRS